MKRCKFCGNENQDNERVCPICKRYVGEPLRRMTQAEADRAATITAEDIEAFKSKFLSDLEEFIDTEHKPNNHRNQSPMPKLPSSFDWRTSSAHLDLLGKFTKPRNVAQVLDWQYLRDTLKENTKDTIERFVRDGALVPCELNEVIECVFSSADLKRMAKEFGLKQAGTKGELAERLLDSARPIMEERTAKFKVMKCSHQTQLLVEEFEQRKQLDLDSAKQNCFDLLKNGDAKGAYKTLIAYQKKYSDSAIQADTVTVDRLRFILSSSPKALGAITEDNLSVLRSAVALSELWYREPAENWLPDTFQTVLKSRSVAINFLKCNAWLREDASRYTEFPNEKIRLVFDEGDVDSCEFCLRLNGQVFLPSELPELPREGCTSETGCKVRIEGVFDEDDSIDETETDSSDDEFTDDEVIKLGKIKKMLDMGLITESEYQQKKSEILSRI